MVINLLPFHHNGTGTCSLLLLRKISPLLSKWQWCDVIINQTIPYD